jgi:hypothetical protein
MKCSTLSLTLLLFFFGLCFGDTEFPEIVVRPAASGVQV